MAPPDAGAKSFFHPLCRSVNARACRRSDKAKITRETVEMRTARPMIAKSS
jgi:hypothetical protein